MMKWISDVASPRREDSVEDDRKQLSDNDNQLMADMVIDEIEAHVVEFVTNQEEQENQANDNSNDKAPDYRWLISTNSENKPKKYLTIQERSKLDRACDRVLATEWAMTLANFKSKIKSATSREMIIDSFVSAVHETILSRPRKVSVGDIVKKYIRSESSVNAVGDSPRPVSASARSLADISFRDITDMV